MTVLPQNQSGKVLFCWRELGQIKGGPLRHFCALQVPILLNRLLNPQSEQVDGILTFWHRRFTFNSSKSPTWCKSFSVYYPDICLQLNMFRAFFPPIIRSSMTAVAASGFTFVSWWQSSTSRFFLLNLVFPYLVKNFPAFYGNAIFIILIQIDLYHTPYILVFEGPF